jgi:hypothetical protein
LFAVVQEMNPSRSGQSQRLKLQGKWYVANSRVNLDGVAKGIHVEYETSSFPGNDGQMIASIARIRPAPQQNGYPPNPRQGSQNAMNSPELSSTITDGDILRSVSNIVGHAAAAGNVSSPQHLEIWVETAYKTLMNMGKAQAPSEGQSSGSAPKDPPRLEPGQDDEPPFYDDPEVPWR